MEYAAFLKLRVSKPEKHRPYRIPLGTFGCFAMMVPTLGATLLVMGLASIYTMVFGFVSVILALFIFHLRRSERVVRLYRQVSSYFVDDYDEISSCDVG
jgi:hypothetical protein